MISCQLIRVSHNSAGLAARSEIRISGESIALGRGSGCQIHLPDQRVGMLHATLTRAGDGSVIIEAAGDTLISVNGYVERTATLHQGSCIGIGPYLLTVEPPNKDFDVVLSVNMPDFHTDRSQALHAPVTLSALGLGKRRLGFGLAALILVILLALPMMTRVSPDFESWQARLPFALTGLHNPGALAGGHGLFGSKCSTCHQHAFQGVADIACTKCHARVGGHLAANASHENAAGEVRCADCHSAHEHKADATRNSSAPCLGCHQHHDNDVAKVRDFGTDHPPFHLTVFTGKDSTRIRQDQATIPVEKSGLKFSHQVHLAPKGVSTPDGDTVLTCGSCHRLEESGTHFAPMKMEMTCQQSRCHKQRFAEPARGVIPHGSEAETMNLLRNFYANWLAEDPARIATGCGTHGSAPNAVRRALDCVESLALQHAASTLFRETGEKLQCALCHELTKTDSKDVPWKLVPLRINRDWQPKAVFGHAKHDTVACTKCHDKTNSRSSGDISFPRIEKCRECHAGSKGAGAKIKSSCQSCHRFHRIDHEPSSS